MSTNTESSINFDLALSESRSMQGALGAIAYGVLKGLKTGGAEPKVIASVRVLMEEHFLKISDVDCNVICDVVYKRMQEEIDRGGSWY